MIEFEINGVQYRAQAMDARRQFHVARRLSSVLSPSADALGKVAPDANSKTNIVAAINGFFDALGGLPDDQLDYVIDACLDTVSRKDSGTWSPIRRAGAMMYDLDLYTQSVIVYHVVRGALDGFFASLPPAVRDMLKGAATGVMARAMEQAQPSGD
jgi:hypothetical protein